MFALVSCRSASEPLVGRLLGEEVDPLHVEDELDLLVDADGRLRRDAGDQALPARRRP